MSKTEIELCSVLLKEYFGEIVQKVGTYLMEHVASRPLYMISSKLSLPLDKVKASLRVLIQHHLAEFCFSAQRFVEYSVKSERVLCLLHYPRYIYCAKILHGDIAELLVEELLNNGRMTMSRVIERVMERLQEANTDFTAQKIRDAFIQLVKRQFICRCPYPKPSENKFIPTLSISEQELYIVPEISLHLLEKDENDEPCSKKQKTNFPDSGIYWRVNNNQFIQYFRTELVLNAVKYSVDAKAAEIVKALFQLSEGRSTQWDSTTKPVARHEIVNVLTQDKKIELKELDPYLGVLMDGIQSFISKADDRSGGMFVVNINKVIQRLVEATVTSVVQDRFGSKCSRIFRLLMMKKYLEIKQIEQFALVSDKDAKEYVYKMHEEGFVMTQEISKTPDYIASRTLFLFHVDINQVSRMLLQRCYQAVYNTILCFEHQNKENKRLLEKKQRVDAIVATLQQSGAAEAQIEEVQLMMTPYENAQLEKVKNATDKLERSQIQLVEMIVLLQLWLKQQIPK